MHGGALIANRTLHEICIINQRWPDNCFVTIFAKGELMLQVFFKKKKPLYDCNSVVTEIDDVPIFYVTRINVVEISGNLANPSPMAITIPTSNHQSVCTDASSTISVVVLGSFWTAYYLLA